MGGRIAIEVALGAPRSGRVAEPPGARDGLPAPARARPARQAVRPELAAIPHPLRAALVRHAALGAVRRPERLDPAAADVAAEEFLRNYRSRPARWPSSPQRATSTSTSPNGDDGFWSRLRELAPPALFVWGDEDRLVPAEFSRHVGEVAAGGSPGRARGVRPRAPVELPERTNRLVSRAHRGPRLAESGSRREERAGLPRAAPRRLSGRARVTSRRWLIRRRSPSRRSETGAAGRRQQSPRAVFGPLGAVGAAGGGGPRAGGGLIGAGGAIAGRRSKRAAGRAEEALSADLDDRDPDYIRENLPLTWLAGDDLLPLRGPQPRQRA